MKIYYSLEQFIPVEKAVVTLGTFDGVHLGHRKLLNRLKVEAERIQGETVLLTFHPHPRKVISQGTDKVPLLSTLNEKILLLEKSGIDRLVIHPFSLEFSKQPYQQFISNVIAGQLHTHTLMVGYDHQFGHKREGNYTELLRLAPQAGFQVLEIPSEDIDDISVSSTRIRKALTVGNLSLANRLLGYPYIISGKVIYGNQLGRTLGFPTANLQPEEEEKLIPANGVYAVSVSLKGKNYLGVLSIGNRPTFDNGARSVEVNIFDFNDDIYGEEVTLHLHNYLRQELKFDHIDDLIMQMEEDRKLSIELLKAI